jgi:hypothetical protein
MSRMATVLMALGFLMAIAAVAAGVLLLVTDPSVGAVPLVGE